MKNRLRKDLSRYRNICSSKRKKIKKQTTQNSPEDSANFNVKDYIPSGPSRDVLEGPNDQIYFYVEGFFLDRGGRSMKIPIIPPESAEKMYEQFKSIECEQYIGRDEVKKITETPDPIACMQEPLNPFEREVPIESPQFQDHDGSGSDNVSLYLATVELIKEKLENQFVKCKIEVLTENEGDVQGPGFAMKQIHSISCESLPTRDKTVIEVKHKRPDQFDKKYHCELKTHWHNEANRRLKENNITNPNNDDRLAWLAEFFGMEITDDDFKWLFGSESHNRLTDDVIEKLLRNEIIRDKLLSVNMMNLIIEMLNKQTLHDIDKNFMKYVKKYLDPLSLYHLNEAYLLKHINNTRACKKPCTYLENILAAEYFYDRLLKIVSKSANVNSFSEDYKERIAELKRENGFDNVPEEVKTAKPNILWVTK
jgi:hypothetical protein